MRKTILLTFIAAILLMLPDTPVSAANGCPHKTPYGDYCPGPHRGWYGAGKHVKTEAEARQILEEYFKGEKVVITVVREKERFFEAEIRDENKALLDVVIVDKRTGRIRSTY
jgi:plasmid stability protein